MGLCRIAFNLALLSLVNALVMSNDKSITNEEIKSVNRPEDEEIDKNPTDVFNGVYTECFMHLSYLCVQRKTLLYLKELNKLSEVSVFGEYVKFVRLNTSEADLNAEEDTKGKDSEDLSFMIDRAVDKFFDNHVMKFSALGRDVSVPNTVDEFVGRKRRKGGGGGGGHGGGDGGKKKMMMMAMMCMKMKLMMMVPAMMGMMGMMSFKGMMFSMMSFMISKMMLLMKLLEKKGGGGGGGSDGGWQTGGGGGGAWMPAGGDYGGGGGGGGYDANGQWQSRSMYEKELQIAKKPNSFVTLTDKVQKHKTKSRSKRGLIDVLQNAYTYWMNRILGGTINRRKLKQPNYKIVNGIKYVYYPMKLLQKQKAKEQSIPIKDEFKPIVIAEDFNKGEIVEASERRMHRKKMKNMADTLNDVVEDNPWE